MGGAPLGSAPEDEGPRDQPKGSVGVGGQWGVGDAGLSPRRACRWGWLSLPVGRCLQAAPSVWGWLPWGFGIGCASCHGASNSVEQIEQGWGRDIRTVVGLTFQPTGADAQPPHLALDLRCLWRETLSLGFFIFAESPHFRNMALNLFASVRFLMHGIHFFLVQAFLTNEGFGLPIALWSFRDTLLETRKEVRSSVMLLSISLFWPGHTLCRR